MIVAIGSNLPAPNGCGPLQNCAHAVRAVAEVSGVFNIVTSRWYSSAPMPSRDQERYVNATASFNTRLTPVALLGALQDIERKAGRVRSSPNAARVLDLDVVSMGLIVREAPDPVLPHPRAHLRAFVLLPLRDVAPSWVHPTSRRTVHRLLRDLPYQDVYPL